jgi:hypothetical protein
MTEKKSVFGSTGAGDGATGAMFGGVGAGTGAGQSANGSSEFAQTASIVHAMKIDMRV